MPAAEHSLSNLLFVLAALLLLTKVMGDLVQRVGQPAVLGELLAGVVLGPSLIGVLDPHDPILAAMAELGVLILLFQIGLHTDVRAILRVGAPAVMVGIAGVVVPFVGGYATAIALGLGEITAVVCGAALTATSIGISARVLADLGQLDTREGLIVLGAAVFDDVIGLITLSVVGGVAAGGVLTLTGVSRISAMALGFLAAALILGGFLAPRMVRLFSHLRVPGAIGTMSLAFALLLAGAAAESGSAMILGAFAAGLVLYPTSQAKPIERATTTIGHFFVPIFFAVVGASIDLKALADPHALQVGGLLGVVAILGKLVSGFAPWWFKGNRLLIGVAMIPRGEVGLIFAQMGRMTGALDEGLFSAVVLVVMVTTFVAPLWLGILGKGATRKEGDRSGLSELVSGPERRPRVEKPALDDQGAGT
jgi:Kef-type K+ transport system membrane component KefB